MPIYEYKCEDCEHQLEMLQKISDAPISTCPECGDEGLRKLISAAAFKLKGTGWYETDFKNKKPENDKESPDTNKKDSKKDADSDSKTTSSDNKTATETQTPTPPPANSSSSE